MILILFKPEMTPCRPKRQSSSTIVPFNNHLNRINIATTCYLPQNFPLPPPGIPSLQHRSACAGSIWKNSHRTAEAVLGDWGKTAFEPSKLEASSGSKMPRWRAVLPKSDIFLRHTAGSVLDLFMFWGPGCWGIGIANLQWLALIRSFIPTSRIIQNAQLWDVPRNENPGITNM